MLKKIKNKIHGGGGGIEQKREKKELIDRGSWVVIVGLEGRGWGMVEEV